MAQEELLLRLPADLLHDLRSLAVQQGHAIEDVAVAELRRGLLLSGSPSRRGLLRGEHSGRLPDREESSAIHLTAPVSAGGRGGAGDCGAAARSFSRPLYSSPPTPTVPISPLRFRS